MIKEIKCIFVERIILCSFIYNVITIRRYGMYTIMIFSDEYGRYVYIKELNCSMAFTAKSHIEDGIYILDQKEVEELVKNETNGDFDTLKKFMDNNKQLSDANENICNNSIITICLHPSRKCNLKCKYCFAQDDENYLPQEEISFEMAKKAIDFLISYFDKKSIKFAIDIAGSGEPLLNVEFIKKLSTYCIDKSNEIKKDIFIKFPTNATLLNEKNIQILESMPNLLLGVSLDGNEYHSVNRIFPDNTLTFKCAYEGTKKLTKNFGIAVTITHENEAVDEVYDFLYEEFPVCDAISMQQVRNFEKENVCSFYNIDMTNMLNHYKKLSNQILDMLKLDKMDYAYKIMRGADNFGKFINRALAKGTLYYNRCDAGKTNIAVDSHGNFYACSVMNGNKDFYIGNITHGLDENKIKEFTEINVDNVDVCRDCWAAYICGGECYVKAFQTNHDFYTPNPSICIFKKELIKIALAFTERVFQFDKNVYEKLKTFEVDNTKNDTSMWILSNYMDILKIEHTFRELNSQIIRNRKGVSVSALIKLAQKYNIFLNPIQINDYNAFEFFDYPIIAFQNKFSNFYRYVLILGYEDNNIILNDINAKITKVPMNYFLDNISNIVLVKK